MKTKNHKHVYTRSRPGATVETCACGKFQHTENAGPAIVAQDALGHTPGPWTLEEAVGKYIVVDDCPNTIAILDDGMYAQAAAMTANARLIAAAPELLAALKAVLDHGQKNDPHHGDLCEVCGPAYEVIAKVEGH